jgi:hypothetical protein
VSANGNGMSISDWKPLSKNTLRGVFTLHLASGMVIHNCMLHEREGRQWIGLPAIPYESNGKKSWTRIIEFSSKEIHERFQVAAIKAVKPLLGERQ